MAADRHPAVPVVVVETGRRSDCAITVASRDPAAPMMPVACARSIAICSLRKSRNERKASGEKKTRDAMPSQTAIVMKIHAL